MVLFRFHPHLHGAVVSLPPHLPPGFVVSRCIYSEPHVLLLLLLLLLLLCSSAATTVSGTFSVGERGSLLLTYITLTAAISVAAKAELSLRAVQIQSSSVSFSGAVSITNSTLISTAVTGSTVDAQLVVSGGLWTASALQINSFAATVRDSCVLVNSNITVAGQGGVTGTLNLTQAELRSNGVHTVPLDIQAGGNATVTQSSFQSTAGDITVVSVASGGNLTVGDSQLVYASGQSVPFPCDGTLPHCTGAHQGSVDVDGPSVITLASPLVCDSQTGACLSIPAALVAAGVTAEQFIIGLGNGLSMESTAQCFMYTILDDAWRATSNDCSGRNGPSNGCHEFIGGMGGNIMGDVATTEGTACHTATTCDPNSSHCYRATGVGGGGWYRFTGAGGDAMALTPPGSFHCGAFGTGWLSGWNTSGGTGAGCNGLDGGTGPPCGFSMAGRYPTMAEGVVEMTACFDWDPRVCDHHISVGVVRCTDFLLWQLPYTNALSIDNTLCDIAFCTGSSGL